MKNLLVFKLTIAIVAICSYCLQPQSAVAQGEKSKVKFFCTYSQDGKLTPYTSVGIVGTRAEHREIVKWSDYKNRTAEQRCQEATRKFQAAWDRGSFHRLVDGKNSSREGIICALSYRQTTCDSSHQLFVLKNARESKEIVRQLYATIGGAVGSRPAEQSGDPNEIDMQQLIESISRSPINNH
jgi:Circadian oscillating protein COP23